MPHPIRIGDIYVGVGGWTYEGWDKHFYPEKLAKKRQLEFMSRAVTAIEINGTFYRLQKPDTFKKWAGETPDDFRFTLKAHNFCTSRKTPDDMKSAIDNFVQSGVTELQDKLGAINWQFPPTRKFDAEYFEAFCSRLPKDHEGVKLRHAIEVRHETFNTPAFHDLLRKHACALVSADDDDWPQQDVETTDFAYARLQRTRVGESTGYPASELDAWAKTFKSWSKTRSVFAFFIAGAKETNPTAAQALIKRL